MVNSLTLVNSTEQYWLVQDIREAEKGTTGELRVHFEDFSLAQPLDRAAELFAALGMEKTKYRNGVLIYIASTQEGLAIIGDLGINKLIPDHFWVNQKSILQSYFKQGYFYEGLAVVIGHIGEAFRHYFPLGDEDNPNELPNELSIQ